MTKFSKFYITLLTLFVISCISGGARADYTALEAQCRQGFFPNCLTLLNMCSSWLGHSASPNDLQTCLGDENVDGTPDYRNGTIVELQCAQYNCDSEICEATNTTCEGFFNQCMSWVTDGEPDAIDGLTACQLAQCLADENYNSIPMYRDNADSTSKDTDGDGIVNKCDPQIEDEDQDYETCANAQSCLEQECVRDGCTSGFCEAPSAACAPFFEQCEHWLRGSDQDIDYDLTACQLAQCMVDENNNGIPMYRDTADSTSKDTDGDGVVNECDPTQSSGGTNPDDAGGTNPDDAGDTDPDDAGGTNPDDAGGTDPGDAGGGTPTPTDTDLDGKPDAQDNCPATWNSPQDDTDGDGIGDACDLCIRDANQNRDGSDCPKGDNKDTSGNTAGNNSNQYTSPTDSARGGGNCSLAPGEIPLNALSYIPMLITLVLLRIKRRWK